MENVQREKLPFSKRIEAFFDRNYALFLAPLIVAALYLFVLWQNGVYPFGNKYTAASFDLSAQICPFIEHLFDVFDGKSTLTFSYAIVGGADVTGTFLYFFISPFSFLFLIFGDGKVAYASSIVLLCKLICIAVAGAWFAQKQFKGIPDYICAFIGITYAYCGYTFVSNTYINWMDFLIYLPFTVAAFRHFVKTGKFLPFSILVACCIYTCFSIACFSLFIVFPTLIAYGLICVEKEERHSFNAHLCLSFVVSILMALPVLFPALGAYSVSGRGGSIFENLWKGYSYNATTDSVGAFSSKNFLDWFASSLYPKWSYILSDSIFVVLTLVWFFRKGLKDKFARFMLVAGVLTMLPNVVDESMNLLNMGSYMSYALRFGFLNALYFLGGACLCLEGLCYKPFTAYDGTNLLATLDNPSVLPLKEPSAEIEEAVLVEEADVKAEVVEAKIATEQEEKEGGRYEITEIFKKGNLKPLLWIGGVILLALVGVIFLLWFSVLDNRKGFLQNFEGSTSSSNSNLGNIASNFAWSRGGLEVISVFFIVVALVAIVGCFLVSFKKISPRFLAIVLMVVVGTQVMFYNEQLVVGTRSTQHTTFGHYETLNEELNSRDDSYFRVKDYNDKMTSCVPFTGNANSFSVFSSVINKDNFVMTNLFGYKGNSKNQFKSSHDSGKANRSDEFGDSFLGYKYFISTNKSLKLDYIEPVYAFDENGEVKLDEKGNKVQLSSGGMYVYENKIVFPLGYRVPSGGFDFVVENNNNKDNRTKNQQALYKYLRGQDLKESTGSAFVTPKSATELSEYLHGKAADVKVSAGKITAKVTAEEGEDLLLNFVAAKGYSVTVNGKKAKLVDNDLKFLLVSLEEGENEVVFTYSSPYVTYMVVGVAVGLIGLLTVAFVLKRTKVVEKIAPVISWAGIALAFVVVGFFMVFPTGVWVSKIVNVLKGLI